jgi:predicted transcriptional regulator
MRLKLCIAATIFAAAPIVAFAQDDNSNAEASKPTIENA